VDLPLSVTLVADIIVPSSSVSTNPVEEDAEVVNLSTQSRESSGTREP
jgi:hypothetical protein